MKQTALANQQPVIGLEVHVQLNTKTKLFCPCPSDAKEPNSACCPTCLGMPGSKPSLNKKAMEYALKVALALGCRINKEFYFSRKTYFYPDLAKNYQITQYEVPFAEKGKIVLKGGKAVKLTRIHLEEDPASLVHEQGIGSSQYCLVDYNRSGIPLVEIVTEPCMESAEEAREFLNSLLATLEYLGVFEQGKNAMKCDANISIKGNEKAEVKNITSFKGVEKAIQFEIQRQKKLVAGGKKTERQTRGFDEKSGKTVFQRSKETEDDYGYIFEPDLPMFTVNEKQLDAIRNSIPELSPAKAARLEKQYKIPFEHAEVLSSSKMLADLFEKTAKNCRPETAAAFLRRELLAVLNRSGKTLQSAGLSPKELSHLFRMFDEGKVNEKTVKEALINQVKTGVSPREFVKKNDLIKDMNESKVGEICEKTMVENKDAVKDYLSGEKKAFNFLVGMAMREARGKAEPRQIQKTMLQKLESKK